MRLELGSPVNCTDGPFGKLADVVIDPTKRRVTHLVVEPHGDHGKARLVPIELANTEAGRVFCDRGSLFPGGGGQARARRGVRIHSARRITGPGARVGHRCRERARAALLRLWRRRRLGYETVPAEYDPHVSVTYDRIPKGEVEIRRASEVTSADGHQLGKVDGFLVDDDDAITHFVLERGHLWGRRGSDDPDQRSSRASTPTRSRSPSRRTRSASSRRCPSTAGAVSCPLAAGQTAGQFGAQTAPLD